MSGSASTSIACPTFSSAISQASTLSFQLGIAADIVIIVTKNIETYIEREGGWNFLSF